MKKFIIIMTMLISGQALADGQKFNLAYKFKDTEFRGTVIASSFDQAIEKGSQSCISHMFRKYRVSQLTEDEKHMLASACANPRTY